MTTRYQVDAALTAVQFLTRVPVPGGMNRPDPDLSLLRASVIYYPLVGSLIGLFTAGTFTVGLAVWPPLLAAAVALALEALLTGAFHEDAVADCCDAFGGGWSRDDVLRIMKDSRVGSFGALGLMLAVALRGLGLAHLDSELVLTGIVASATLGRTMILPLMAFVPPIPHREGLAKDVGQRIGGQELVTGLLLSLPGLAGLAWVAPVALLLASLLSGLAVLYWGWYLRRRLGGLTGDCLGAACYTVQVIVFLALVARWPGAV